MAKLCEGSRVFTATTGVAGSSTDMNELQDQLKNILNAQWQDVTNLFVNATGSTWEGAAGILPGWKTAANPALEYGWLVLPVREGWKITSMEVINQDTGQNGGEIALYSAQLMAVGSGSGAGYPSATASKIADIGPDATNPWNPTGTNTWHRTQTAVSTVVQAGYIYYVFVESSTGGATQDFLYRVAMKCQMGN